MYAAQQRALGPTDRDTLRTRIHLGGLLSDTGDLAGARALLEPSLPEFTAALGADHPLTRSLLGFLAVVLKRQGDLVPARALEERLLDAPPPMHSVRQVNKSFTPQVSAVLRGM